MFPLAPHLEIGLGRTYMLPMSNAAPYRHAGALAIRPVDAIADARTLVAFGRDLYLESLGDETKFQRDYGRRGQKFPFWIASCAARNPDFAAFLTVDETPIGFTVVGADMRDRRYGHVHHFYVAPDYRGRGYGGLLDDYARETLASAGYGHARLNVTTRNARAIRFYVAQGWRDIGGSKNGALRFMETPL